MKKGIGVLQQQFLELVRHIIQVLLGKIIVFKVSYINEPASLAPRPPCPFLLFFLQFVFNKSTSLGGGMLGRRVTSSTN